MPVTYEQVKAVAAQLYGSALKKVPEDTKAALVRAHAAETSPVARSVLSMMIASARRAEEADRHLCSDAGIPTYFVKIGTAVTLQGNIRQAISDGFDHLVATIQPPILKHVTNPLTLERGHKGRSMPLVSFDLVDGADYLEIVCSPKGLGAGRWAALEIFSFPTLDVIERYVMDCVLKAGSQHCPPVVIGVGIGGTFDVCAKLAKQASLRPFGLINPEPILADMEARLLDAVNKTGFGPMGTGGDTTALAVHVDYAASHGFVPVAVCFNCWINRRAGARLYDDGRIETFE
ncbi:fumarate hydratase [Rhodoplanes sp. TEM]|uniref:Fumarate hydratase n=1 Tax=Rhodoplanes tepidamans TaxID=200616 RepID=A0ABT5JIT6_RHOTP|nr:MULTISPECIES: fumarate hydratase [Rhodoplanes]MDC7789646.1 fumarate hydratase [Rhodoplanes tepidamans]MDC7985255.1 fumarate hydratase [Rhodoplanes sp. TEM]MDQ0353582.1 fumarate hydratase subunit alpha [Rhodoplanes tepidamans]